MANINIVKGEIGNALTSVAPDHILGVANDIFDENRQRYQQDINTELLGRSDGAFDVSAKYPTSGVEGGNTYTLEGALAVLDANLSADKKKGGMSIKFVQSSDNKYVQYRLMTQNFTTDVTQWQGVDDEPTAGSDNLVKSGGVFRDIYDVNERLGLHFEEQKAREANFTAYLKPMIFKNGKKYYFSVKSYGTTSTDGVIIRLYYDDTHFTQIGTFNTGGTQCSGNFTATQNSENGWISVFSPSGWEGFIVELSTTSEFATKEELTTEDEKVEGLNRKIGEVSQYTKDLEISSSTQVFFSQVKNFGKTIGIEILSKTAVYSDMQIQYKVNNVNKYKTILDSVIIEENDDITQIQLFFGANKVTTAGNVVFKVFNGLEIHFNSLEKEIEELGNENEEQDTKIIGNSHDIADINEEIGNISGQVSIQLQITANTGVDINTGRVIYNDQGNSTSNMVEYYSNFVLSAQSSLRSSFFYDKYKRYLGYGTAPAGTKYVIFYFTGLVVSPTYSGIRPSSGMKGDIQQIEYELQSLEVDKLIQMSSNFEGLGNLDIAKPTFDYNHIIVYGQSFAQGGGYVGNTNDVAEVYCVGKYTGAQSANLNQGLWKMHLYEDAENAYYGHYNGILTATCANAFAKLWKDNHNKNARFLATNGGYGSTTIEQLSKGGEYYNKLYDLLVAAKGYADNENKTIGCIGVIFIQGENNYNPSNGGTNDKSEYAYLVNKLKEDMIADIKSVYGQTQVPIFITYQTGNTWIKNKELTISQAQLELGTEKDTNILGCPSYQMSIDTDKHPTYDGYGQIGELMAKYLYSAMENNNRYCSPHPIGFTLDGNVIYINCYVPIPPLRIDTDTVPQITNYGFEVFENNTPVTITSIEVQGNIIKLTLDSEVSGVVEISYAGFYNNSSVRGYGNICDSDSKYKSIQISNGLTRNSILREPHDLNGRSLVGRHLPLQNWLSNFYKNLSLYFVEHFIKASLSDSPFANKLINKTVADVVYSSSDTSVATVNSSTGVLNFVATGHCVIYATITIGNNSWKDSYLLTVE